MNLFTSLMSISLGAILVNNFILAQFLGICPFMGVSQKTGTAMGMGLAVMLTLNFMVPKYGFFTYTVTKKL